MVKGVAQRIPGPSTLGLLLTLVSLQTAETVYFDDSPVFNTTPEHIQAKEGDRVMLPCQAENLGKYKVIWVNPRKILMSHADSRLIDDHRISVERGHPSVWNLLIRDVRHNDSGTYECRTNTDPVQTKKITLDVRVPPSILSSMSTDQVTVVEGEKITLICNVTGIPPPNVTWWRRKPGKDRKEQVGEGGEVLIIHNVTRTCAEAIECRVDNGVPPAVSKAIDVTVEFPPEVVVPPPKRLGQVLGKETILECTIFAEPQGVTAWEKDGIQLRDGQKYEADMMEDVVNKAVILTLRIRELKKEDFGVYVCTGSNYLGSDMEKMVVYEIEPPPTTTTTTTTTTTLPIPVIHGGHNNVPYIGEDARRWENRRQGGEGRYDYEDGAHYDRGQAGSNLYDTERIGRKGDPATSSHREGKPSRSHGEDDTWAVFGSEKDASSRWVPQTWLVASLVALAHLTSQLSV